MGRQYSTETNEVLVQKESGLFDKINTELQWNYVKNNPTLYIAFLLLCMVAFPIQYAVVPTLLTQFATKMTKDVPRTEMLRNVWSNLKTKNVAGIIVALLIMWIIVGVCFMGRETIGLKIFPRHLHHIRQRMFEALIQRHREQYDDIPSGEAITRVLDVSRLYAYQSEALMVVYMPYIIGLIVVIVYTFTRSRALGVCTTIILLLLIANSVFWGEKIGNVSAKREGKYIYMVEKMNNNFNNLMSIYINNKEDDAISTNNELNEEHTALFEREMQLSRDSNAYCTAISIIGFAIILCGGFIQVKRGTLSKIHLASIVVVYVLYLQWSLELFHELPYLFRRYGIYKNSYEFVHNLFKQTDSSRSDFKIRKGTVELRNVTFHYPGETANVLDKYNLLVNQGEKVAIVGRSGSGKTTIMKLVIGLHQPVKGTVLIDGHPIDDIQIHEVRSKVNYINQRTILMNDSILKNMQYGNDTPEADIRSLLTKYNLMSVFSDVDEGILANAGVNGGNLSLGMQKTVIVVRGLLKKAAKIYIFDEPVAGLDPVTRGKIMNMIQTECSGKTIICVTHLKEIEDFVDRTIYLTKNPG